MKINKSSPAALAIRAIRGLSLAVAITTLTAYLAQAHPYATCLTNNAGTVSFRINESNAVVKLLWAGGASSYDLGTIVIPGLTVTNIPGLTSPFQVSVTKSGAGTPTLISDNNNDQNKFFGPRAIGVNKRPASPYFGRIYVGNSQGVTASGAGRNTGDGIYVLNADSSDALNRGTNASSAGLNMVPTSASMPWRVRVGKDDDNLYICDFTDSTGNLFVTDPDVATNSVATNVFMLPVGAMASPLDGSMNHGSLSEVYVEGSIGGANLTVWTTDEDYETNPGFQTEENCLWRYDIGAGPLGPSGWSAYPNQKVGNASITFTASQVMGLDRGTNGYFYLSDGRSSGNEFGLTVIDPAGPTLLWDSKTTSTGLGAPKDLLSNIVSVAVSPDMRFCAVMRSTGLAIVMPLVNGIPNLAGRIEFTAIGTARQIVFDAADNLYTISASTERMRIYSMGLTTTAITTSDATGSGGAGGSFILTTPATTVSVTTDTNVVYEAGATTNIFTIVRNNDDLSQALTVSFSMTGTATRTNDYVLKTNGVTMIGNSFVMPIGVGTMLISLVAVDDTTAETNETATLNIIGTPFYSAGIPASASVNIVDNEFPMVDITVAEASMYERLTNDYTRILLTRRGDTNAASFTVNLGAPGGSAAASRYAFPANPVATFDPGDVTKTVDITPLNDNLLQGDQTITVTVAAGSGYTVGTNAPLVATLTIVDDEVPPETTILYSENFNVDNSANWTELFAANNGVDDFRYIFSYDYSSGASIPAIPPAPHSAADTLGMYLSVNKDDSTALGAAGINLYPLNQSFSNNYAVRFDMYLMVGTSASTTEHALMGINHSATKTNWFRSGGVPVGWAFDGLFYGVESDGAALGDYVIYSTNGPAANNPFALTPGVNASTLTGIFKNPPFGGNILPGAPGCTEGSATPSWADVEISKIGKRITLKIDNTTIMVYTNTTSFTNGDLMLGYCDSFDSIQAGHSGVVYDNLRVVRLDITITKIQLVGANAEVTFTWGIDDPATVFKLQTATVVSGPYTDSAATIAKLSPGVYKATLAGVTGLAKFYKIRYLTP